MLQVALNIILVVAVFIDKAGKDTACFRAVRVAYLDLACCVLWLRLGRCFGFGCNIILRHFNLSRIALIRQNSIGGHHFNLTCFEVTNDNRGIATFIVNHCAVLHHNDTATQYLNRAVLVFHDGTANRLLFASGLMRVVFGCCGIIETRVNRCIVCGCRCFGFVSQKFLIGDVLGFCVLNSITLFGIFGDKLIKIFINGGLLSYCAAVGLFADCIVDVHTIFVIDAASHVVGNTCFLKFAHCLSYLPENVLLSLVKLLVAATKVVAPCFFTGTVNLNHIPTVFSGNGAASLLQTVLKVGSLLIAFADFYVVQLCLTFDALQFKVCGLAALERTRSDYTIGTLRLYNKASLAVLDEFTFHNGRLRELAPGGIVIHLGSCSLADTRVGYHVCKTADDFGSICGNKFTFCRIAGTLCALNEFTQVAIAMFAKFCRLVLCK